MKKIHNVVFIIGKYEENERKIFSSNCEYEKSFNENFVKSFLEHFENKKFKKLFKYFLN